LLFEFGAKAGVFDHKGFMLFQQDLTGEVQQFSGDYVSFLRN
jgi:hypothetical protein